MKRNSLPGRDEPLIIEEERKILDERLQKLFSGANEASRQISIGNKGHWIPDRRHARVESTRGIPTQLLSYSAEFAYHYLKPFEALYCFESSQLLIYFNDCPLSQLEAYELLLDNLNGCNFTNYFVFQQLNRSGYVCLAPEQLIEDQLSSKDAARVGTKQLRLEVGRAVTGEATYLPNPEAPSKANQQCSTLEPLTRISSTQVSFKEVLAYLREMGPSEYQLSPTSEATSNPIAGNYKATFQVYKKKNYDWNKPRKGGHPGNPDYLVSVVCNDGIHKKRPCWKQIIKLDKEASVECAAEANRKPQFLLALVDVDVDYSICYVQFEVVKDCPERC